MVMERYSPGTHETQHVFLYKQVVFFHFHVLLLRRVASPRLGTGLLRTSVTPSQWWNSRLGGIRTGLSSCA